MAIFSDKREEHKKKPAINIIIVHIVGADALTTHDLIA